MPENIAQTVQQVIQNLIAPDVRELKVLVIALQKQMDQRSDAQQTQMDQRFDMQDKRAEAQSQKADAQFEALMAAFGEFKAQSELATIRAISQ